MIVLKIERPEVAMALNNVLKGPVYKNESPNVWSKINSRADEIRKILNVMGIELEINEKDGYAVIRQGDFDELEDSCSDNLSDSDIFDNPGDMAYSQGQGNIFGVRKKNNLGVPRLIRQTPMSFRISYLLLKIRQKLHEYEISYLGSEDPPMISDEEIFDIYSLIESKINNEQSLRKVVAGDIETICNMKFLRKISPGKARKRKQDQYEPVVYEIRTVIKSFIDAQKWLPAVGKSLEDYLASVESDSKKTDELLGENSENLVFEEGSAFKCTFETYNNQQTINRNNSANLLDGVNEKYEISQVCAQDVDDVADSEIKTFETDETDDSYKESLVKLIKIGKELSDSKDTATDI